MILFDVLGDSPVYHSDRVAIQHALKIALCVFAVIVVVVIVIPLIRYKIITKREEKRWSEEHVRDLMTYNPKNLPRDKDDDK